MPIIKKSAIVPYTAEQMYRLVDNIEDYPQFLPWCKHADVLYAIKMKFMLASLLLGVELKNRFQPVTVSKHNKMIEMRLKEGPFEHLEGFWRFEALGDEGCKISFDLEFEFSTKLLSMMLGPIFTQMTGSLVEAFSERAQQLYGKVENGS